VYKAQWGNDVVTDDRDKPGLHHHILLQRIGFSGYLAGFAFYKQLEDFLPYQQLLHNHLQ
jgi:hypothetical protein